MFTKELIFIAFMNNEDINNPISNLVHIFIYLQPFVWIVYTLSVCGILGIFLCALDDADRVDEALF